MTINIHDEGYGVTMLPCTCGNEDIEVWRTFAGPEDENGKYYLRCFECEFSAPTGDTIADAILQWNAAVEAAN